jgi:hypothetical protein
MTRRAMRSSICLDCHIDTMFILFEYYVVYNEIWKQATEKHERLSMLCIGCLEKRLGRKLCKDDFKNCPVNKRFERKSQRLQERLQT